MFSFFLIRSEAVQYRGKYLYEELVEKGEFDPRQNGSKIEMRESYLLANANRIDATFRESNTLRRYESRTQLSESFIECDEDETPSINIFVIWLGWTATFLS